MTLSYNVRIWKIREHVGKKKTTYSLRWIVQGATFCETFATKALATSFRASLLTATRTGEAFDTETGLPISWKRSAETTPTWYETALVFCDMKWPNWAPKSRKAGAEALATVTAALVKSDKSAPPFATLYRALIQWSFNTTARNRGEMPTDCAEAIHWVERHSVKLDELSDTETVRRALTAIGRKLDGQTAAANTANRKRFVFHQALSYAIERGLLTENPLNRIKWKAPRSDEVVDRRAVANPSQARALLAGVATHSPYGKRIVPLYALSYFAALRPGEVADLYEDDCDLPETGWGTLYLARSNPHAGKAWTDNGEVRESRQLKHRNRKDVRPVPAHPELVSILRTHIEEFGVSPDGRIVHAPRGGVVPESTYGKIWRETRVAVLTAELVGSVLAKRPYDLRHACVSTWLNAGVPATQVAEWAGHSVDVLLRVYAKCIDGQDGAARKRIEEALKTPPAVEDRGDQAP